jgi:hypothetical protein
MADGDKKYPPGQTPASASRTSNGWIQGIPVGGTESSSYYTGVPQDFIPDSGTKPKEVQDPKTGKISNVYYNPDLDANVILRSVDDVLRGKMLKGIATKISGYDPGSGYEEKDKKAFAGLLEYANIVGLPWAEAYASFMQKIPNSSYVKKAPSIRVTSADDVKTVVRKSSRDLLGYEIDDMTASRIAGGFRQMEIAEGQRQAAGGVYEAAPDPSVFAEKQILKKFAPEAKSFAAANYAQIMDARIKALGA